MIALRNLPAAAIFALAISPAFSQLGMEGQKAGPSPSSEVLHLAMGSDFAVVGTLVKTTGIVKRLSQEELIKLDDLSKSMGGEVFSIHVEDVIIKRADFGGLGSEPRLDGANILIYKPEHAPYYPNAYYEPRKRYLIFLTPIQNQSELQKTYKLDARQTYYQEFEPRQGVMAITDKTLPFLTKLKQLGDAVRPVDPRLKLKRLRALATSNDPDLNQSAVEAISLIQRNLHR